MPTALFVAAALDHETCQRLVLVKALGQEKKFSPHVLQKLYQIALVVSINNRLFSFVVFWKVNRDARDNAISVLLV